MKFKPAAIAVLTAAAPFCAPALAHHSQAMFDNSQEILIEGTVERFDWVNPHMYLIVRTTGPDGQPALVEGEGLGITQALVDGLEREDLAPGTPVIMRANPNRGGWGKQVRILDVTTTLDGEVHPFYTASTRTRTLTPAESLEGHWAPSRAALGAGFGGIGRWQLTPEGQAARAANVTDGLCFVEPIPFLAVIDELRTIELGDSEVIMKFDNTGDRITRTIHMNAEHPANVTPSHDGHSIGRWEGETLVIDTIGYEPNLSGGGLGVPSSPAKHTIERLTLTEDRKQLRYEFWMEDPQYLAAPGTLTQNWDHRPDLDFSQQTEGCDDDVAARYKDHVPE